MYSEPLGLRGRAVATTPPSVQQELSHKQRVQRVIIAVVLVVIVATGTLLMPREPNEESPAAKRSYEEAAPALEARRTIPSATSDSSTDCIEALAKPAANSQLMSEQKQLAVASFIKEHGSPLEQDLIADVAGIRPDTRAVLDTGLPAVLFLKYGAPRPSEAHKPTDDELRRVEDVLGSAWREGLTSPTTHETTLAAYLVREHGDAVAAALPALDGVLPIGLYELAVAIEVGWAPADFQVLLDISNVDVNARWYNGANLAKVAAIYVRPGILRLLTSRGVDPSAELMWDHGSVLDDMALMRTAVPMHTPAPPLDEEAFADVVRQLIAAGDRPYLPSTLSALRKWLPGTPMPTLHSDAAALLTPAIEATAKAVGAMDAEWNEKVEAARRLERRCDTVIADAVEHAVFLGTDLAAKQRYSEALDRRETRSLEKLAAAQGDELEADAPSDGPAEPKPNALLQAVTDQRWTDAVAIADQEGGLAPLFVLHIALGSEAPLDVLVALINRTGGSTPQDVLRSLAQNRRPDAAQIAEALEPYGLDPHAVDAQGRNGFTFIAGANFESESTWRFAEYLASHAVTVKPNAYGLDPLDTVLLRLLDLPLVSRAGIPFVRFLIDHGAPIEPSHLQLAESISKADAETYRRLVNVVPELAS